MHRLLKTSKANRARTWSNWAFTVVIATLVPLGIWWTVLIGRLVNENAELRIQAEGDTPEAHAEHDRRRLMAAGEGGLMAVLTIAVVGLSYGTAMRERSQLRRLEGVLAASTHELKTPIAGIRALLESLESGVLTADRMGPHLTRALGACTRLEHLVDATLTWQAAVANPESAVRNTEIRPLEDWLAPLLPGAELDLGEAGSLPVRASADALRVIVENLWVNANKYGAKSIVVTAAADGRFVLVSMRDDGIGFNPADAQRMFEPYQRLHTHTRGTGLGLYISRTLAQAMGGDLSADSDGPNLGSTFTLALPGASRSAE